MDKDTFDMFKKMQEGFGLMHDRILIIEAGILALTEKLKKLESK